MMAFIEMQLFAILSATICGSLVLFLSRPWNKELRTSSNTNYYGHVALGFAAGYTFAFWFIMGEIPGFPAEEAYHSLFYVACIVPVIAFINAFISKFYFRVICIVALSFLAAMLIIPEWVFEDDDGNLSKIIWAWRCGYAIFSILLFVMMERLQGIKNITHSFIWFLTATGASLIMIFAASAKIAQLCGAISAMSMATCVVCLLLPHISLTKGGLYFLSVFVPGLIVNGYLIGSEKIPFISFILVAAAPLSVYLVEIPSLQKKFSSITLEIIRVIPVLITIVISLAIGYSYFQ